MRWQDRCQLPMHVPLHRLMLLGRQITYIGTASLTVSICKNRLGLKFSSGYVLTLCWSVRKLPTFGDGARKCSLTGYPKVR